MTDLEQRKAGFEERLAYWRDVRRMLQEVLERHFSSKRNSLLESFFNEKLTPDIEDIHVLEDILGVVVNLSSRKELSLEQLLKAVTTLIANEK